MGANDHDPIFTAIIIGGGIGGLRLPFRYSTLEWVCPCVRTGIHASRRWRGLVLWANAIRALDALGVAGQIRALKPPAPSAGLYTASGKVLLQASVEALERQVGEISIVVHRAELLAILRGALDTDVLHMGRRCTHVEQDNTGVKAYFDGGSVVSGDILIGADGIRSVVRSEIVGDGEPRYAGYTSYRAVTTFDHARFKFGDTGAAGCALISP